MRRRMLLMPVNNYDPDALAFILAAGLTDTTQKSAINTLVLDLKSFGLWSKFKAIYPIIGGTAFTHKFNLKDPRDLNVAYRLAYSDTGLNIIHSSYGIRNSAAQYCITHLNPFGLLSPNSHHVSNYCVTNITGLYVDMGCSDSSTHNWGIYQSASGTFASDSMANTNRITVANSDSRGFYIGSRTSSSSHKGYKNGISIVSSTATISNTMPNSDVVFLRFGLGSSAYNSPRTYAFFTIGDGLDDTDALNLYNIVQAYQTTLGRNV